MTIRVNEVEIPWREGMTVEDALQAMGYDFVHISVTIDDEYVDHADHARRLVPDGADVRAIHLFHGG